MVPGASDALKKGASFNGLSDLIGRQRVSAHKDIVCFIRRVLGKKSHSSESIRGKESLREGPVHCGTGGGARAHESQVRGNRQIPSTCQSSPKVHWFSHKKASRVVCDLGKRTGEKEGKEPGFLGKKVRLTIGEGHWRSPVRSVLET